MSDQRLQETWSCFAQTEPGHVVERRRHLDDFLSLLLLSARGETPISNLLHFSDIGSVVSLLGGQFLADIEHICLGSVSYDSDASSSATSRSVGSIVSDASRASDGSRGCRPRVTKRTGAGRGHCFTIPPHLPHLVQEHLLPDSDCVFENQEQQVDIQSYLGKGTSSVDLKEVKQVGQYEYDPYDSEAVPPNQSAQLPENDLWRFDSDEPTDNASQVATLTTVPDKYNGSTNKDAQRSVVSQAESGKDCIEGGVCEDMELGGHSESLCTDGKLTQDYNNQSTGVKDKENSLTLDVENVRKQDKPTSLIKETGDPNTPLNLSSSVRHDIPLEGIPESSKGVAQRDESPGGSNNGKDGGQGKESQNAASLTHYLQQGCGAKILVALDQLGVTGLTGGREISHVLAFIFTFMLKNSSIDDSASPRRASERGEDVSQDSVPADKKMKELENILECGEGETQNLSFFKYVPSVNLNLEDIFAPVIHSVNSRSNSGGRSSSLSSSQLWMQTSVSKSSSVSSCQSLKKLGKKKRKKLSVCIPFAQSDSEAEENPKRSRLGKALVKFTMNPNDFDYFTRVVYSDDDKCPDLAATLSSAPPRDIASHSENLPCLSLVELLQCIISIQIQLAMHEAELKHLSSPLLATHDILQFSLDTFTSMVSELKQRREHTRGLEVLLMWMLKLVFSSVQRFLRSSELLHTVTELGIIPKLLKLVCLLLDLKFDPDTSENHDVELEETELNKGSECSHIDISRENLALEIIIGILFMLQSSTCLKLEWKDVVECLHLHKVFLQNSGSEIIKKVVVFCQALSLNKRVEILDSVSQLVTYMKCWREDIYHSEKCDKKSHRFCEYRTIQNHHSQVFGNCSSISKPADPGACMISNFCDIMFDCFAGSREAELSACSVKALSRCGLCCCMSSKTVLSKLLEGLPDKTPHILTFVTLYIENIVWRDLSGLAVSDPVKCAFCHVPKPTGSGMNSLSAEYSPDESFMSNFITKGRNVHYQLKNYGPEGLVPSLPFLNHWKGIAVYRKLLCNTEINSKIISHIVRLISQSNIDLKLAMCEHLVIPVLKEICDQGVNNYITMAGHEKEILVSLIKCFRLTLAESSDEKLMGFLETHGQGLITECKDIPGVRHEAFLLLCNTVKKELKMKPNVLVMGRADEESNMVFSKLFEWEVIEHDEFWSAYFSMKAEEVRQRFFIHTRLSMDNSGGPSDGVGWEKAKLDSNATLTHLDESCETGEDVTNACNLENASKEDTVTNPTHKNTLTEGLEVGENGIVHVDCKDNNTREKAKLQTNTKVDAEEIASIDTREERSIHEKEKHFSVERHNGNTDIIPNEPSANDQEFDASAKSEQELKKYADSQIDVKEKSHVESEESVTLQALANESSSASESFPSEQVSEGAAEREADHSGSSQVLLSNATSLEAQYMTQQDVAQSEGFLEKEERKLQESTDREEMDLDVLVTKYTGLGELWEAVTAVLQTSTEFQAFLAGSAVRSLVAPMLVNITQDLARSSVGALSLSSVVLEQLPVTFSLMQSLLTFIIVTYPYAGLHVETLLNELRSPLLRYSPRTCGDVKHLVSVMLQCCILSSSSSLTYTLPHPPQIRLQGAVQHAMELVEEDPGPAGEGVDNQLAETDGYEADTEQLANSSPSSSRFLYEEDDLECPELVLLALDLIINHHEKFVESQEDARMETPARLQDQRKTRDHQTVPKDQSESKDQYVPNNNSKCEDYFELEDQFGPSEWVVPADHSEHRGHPVKDPEQSEDHHMNDEQPVPESQEHHEAVNTKMRHTKEGIKFKAKRSSTHSCSQTDSVSSTSSVYHTFSSDEEASTSVEEHTSDWDDFMWRDQNLDASRETVINNLSPRSGHGSVLNNELSNLSPKEESVGHQFPRDSRGLVKDPEPSIEGRSSIVSSKEEPARNSSRSSASGFVSGPSLCCESEASHSASLTQCIHALLLLCRSSTTICRRLHSLGLLSRLLDGFNDLICANNQHYIDVVGTVVAVWAEVGRWCLAPTELSQFFTLFKASSAPLEILLRALSRVLEGSGTEPQCALQYPCHVLTTTSVSPTLNASHNSLSESLASFVNIRVPASPVVEAITRLHESHCRHGILSCASVCCVVCPVPRTLDWSPYNSGLACTTWMCVRDRSGVESKQRCSPQSSLAMSCGSEAYFDPGARCTFSRGATSNASVSNDLGPSKLHVMSVGTQHLMFSLWVDPSKDMLQVCVSREVDRESTPLSQGVVMRAGLCDGAWHHLALCIPTINVRRGGNLKVTLLVDSLTCHSVSVLVPAVGSIKKSSPSYLMLGHTDLFCEEPQSSCPGMDDGDPHGLHKSRSDGLHCSHHHQLLMGNTFLFREPILSRELCLYLIALGKDTTSLIPLTDKDERVVMAPFITPKLLAAGMDLSVLYGHMESVIRPAQESLLVLHTTQCPSEYLCYKPHMPTLQDTGNHYPLCSTQAAVLFGEVTPLCHQGPDLALLHMGGVAHIVYLFARLVELRSEEREQAAALKLLIHCIHTSPQLAAQYEGLRGSSLVFRILRSPLSCPGVQVMKALVDGCTSPSVVQYMACRDVYTVAAHVPAILIDRALISMLITNWKTFLDNFSKEQNTKFCVNEKGERITVIGIILSVLKVLLSENQPYRDFNLAQLRDINALDKILFMCKELELTTGSLDSVCSASLVVSVVTGLVGAASPMPWRNIPSGTGLGLSAQESYSSGFCSGRPSTVGLPINPMGFTSYGLGSPVVRVRDVAAVYGFLLLVHPAHLTYAATEHHTAYYLPHIPTTKTTPTTNTSSTTTRRRRRVSSIAVGVDLAAELIDRPEKPQILHQFQAGDWQVIENSDPLVQLEMIREQQQAEIRKLRREGSIAKSAYCTHSSEEEGPEEGCDSSSMDRKASSVVNSEDQFDGVALQRSSSISRKASSAVNNEDQVDGAALQCKKNILSQVVSVSKTEESNEKNNLCKRAAPENQSNIKDVDAEENSPLALGISGVQGCNAEQSLDNKRTERVGDSPPRITKWAEDIGETEEEDSAEEDESTSSANLSCLTKVVVGLLEMLEAVLRYSSDTTARTLLTEALYMDQTLVMANHPHPVIRCAVLKLFSTILDRCSPEDSVLHLRQHVPLIMAQQLHKHSSVSSHLVMAAFSLALGRSFTFEDYAVDCDSSLAFPHKVVLFIPLMAVLPHSSQDIALCHNTLMVMLDLLHKNTELIIPLIYKAHFVDALLCTLKSSLHTEGVGVSDVTGESECEVVVSDITEILSWIVNCLVASTQHKNFLLSLEVLHHLNLLCRGESAVCGGQASCVGHLQGTEAALLQVALSRIQATASTHQHALTCDTTTSFKVNKTSVTGSSSLHNMKAASLGSPREESDSGVGSVLANYTTIPFTKSLHNISGQLFLSQSRSSPSLASDTVKKEDKVLAHSEILDRFKVLIQKATDFLFMSAWSSVESVACTLPSTSAPESFSLFLLELLLSATATITQRKGNSERCGWERVLWGCQDILRLHLNHLLALVTSPRTHIHTRVRAAQVLAKHPRLHAIISYTSKVNPQLLYKVGIFVHELRYQNESRLDTSATRSCEALLHVLEECAVQVLPPPELYPPHGAMREWSVVSEEKKQWQDESAKIAILVVDRYTKQDERLLTKNTQVYEAVAQECSRLTRSVVDRQNMERKMVLGGIKHAQCHHVHLTHRWRDLMETLTHERATWHFPHSYPRSWQLDQTEGPLRTRKRLTRGRLHIQSRYLMPEYRQKIDIESQPPPLEAVLQGSPTESAMAVMIERLNVSERIVHMSSASVVSPGMEQCGEILISRTAMYFVGEQVTVDMNQSGTSNEVVSVTWPLDTVREIHIRRYQLQDCALELFLTSGHSVLLAFADTQHRNQVIGMLSMSDMPNLLSKATLPEVTTQWREGHITNFEYLTQLNKLAGRSFNDLMQYPVFPFILSNYTTDILSLNDATSFRNLRKPIAVQHQAKEQHYINNYEITSQISQDAGDGPYHYGSHYSNSGIVLHFLVRLPPFTQLFLRYQDGNFDIPDRTFHAMQTTWRLASSDSTTDFKELIPEFFFLPEMFLNSEGFNMGVRQSGERVHHVQLPPWSGDDPRRFVLVHRAALESPLVTQNLHHWIDLVFGYKQTGKAAMEAINVFHPATYFGYDVENGSDEISREARKAMIKTYGQTPQQLFTNPHPVVGNTGPSQNPQAPEVLHEVRGLRWGTYAGSPADDRPILALVQTLKTPATCITSLSQTELLLMPPNTHILTTGLNKGSNGAYVLSSNHQDGIIRCRRLKDNVPQPLISLPPYEQVTWCCCGSSQVWIGLASGQILVYLLTTSHVGEELVVSLPPTFLIAHTAPITHMYLSEAFNVCVSGGKDGMCVLWDTNRLSYIRSIGWSGVEVSLLAMSETLGDWASVTPLGPAASVLRLYTINGALVDSAVTPAPVTALAFTSAPEGTAINVIATSLSDGIIRLWSVWDLRAVRELRTDRARQPITSLHYSQDNLHLCGITESGILLVWESSLVKTKIPKFITIPSV